MSLHTLRVLLGTYADVIGTLLMLDGRLWTREKLRTSYGHGLIENVPLICLDSREANSAD